MSVAIVTHLQADDEKNTSRAFSELVKRMNQSCDFIFEDTIMYDIYKWSMSPQEREKLILSKGGLAEKERLQFFEKLLIEKDDFVLGLYYNFQSGGKETFYLCLKGSEFPNSTYEGLIFLDIDANYLTSPYSYWVSDLFEWKEYSKKDEPSLVELDKIIRDFKNDFRKYLFDVFGLHDNSETYISNGFVNLEEQKSPLWSYVVYHKDIQDLIKDFWRIYLEYHYGIHMPITYNKNAIYELSDISDYCGSKALKNDLSEIYCIIPAEIEKELKDLKEKNNGTLPTITKEYANKLFIDIYDDRELKSIKQFLDDLTEEKINKIVSISEKEIKELLEKMNKYLPEIEYHDFGDKGILLINFYSNLWKVYNYIAKEVL